MFNGNDGGQTVTQTIKWGLRGEDCISEKGDGGEKQEEANRLHK